MIAAPSTNVTPAEAPPALRVTGLVKRFGTLVAVDGVDLSVRPGECFGLLGPNGAGKSTLFEIVAGLQPPTAGVVEVLGRRWGRDDGALREQLGVALQETRLPERLTVQETVALFRSFYRHGRQVADVLADLGLTEKAGAWTVRLSGGQRQRLALACALVGDPQLLILDEPTTGLDPQARLLVAEFIRAFRERGRTVLLSTHAMDEAERLCDRVAVVDHGRVIALDSPAGLVASLGGPLIVEVEWAGGDMTDETLRALPGVHEVFRAEGGVLLSATEAHVAVPALLEALSARGLRPTGLATRGATLEDVFVTLTGRRLRDA